MKKQISLFILSVFTLLQTYAANSIIPLTEVLSEHGLIKPSKCFTGSIDYSGYSVILDPCLGPIFRPNINSGWNPVGNAGSIGFIWDIVINGSDVYVGGNFSNLGGNPNADRIARWDGTTWHALGGGLNRAVRAMHFVGNDLYVGGNFENAGGIPNADYIAKWNGNSWEALGQGLNERVWAIDSYGNDVYIGGNFFNAGGNSNADYIAKWNGFSWSPLGTGMSEHGNVYAIEVTGNNELFAGGQFINASGVSGTKYLAQWKNNTWHAVGNSNLTNRVKVILANGNDIYIGGTFSNAGGNPDADRIARWDGTTWHAVGNPLNQSVDDIAITDNTIYIVGTFRDAGGDPEADRIAKLSGQNWVSIGSNSGLGGAVRAIAIDGVNLYIGGQFFNAGGNPDADKLAVWQNPIPFRLGTPNQQPIADLKSDFENGIEVFPNPVQNILEVKTSNLLNGNVKLFDESGRLILERTLSSNRLKIETSNMPKGVYFMKVYSGINIITKKVIKQ